MPYVIPATPQTPGVGSYVGEGLNKGLDYLLQALLSGQLAPKYSGGTKYSKVGAGQGFPQAPLASPPQTARPLSAEADPRRRFAGFQMLPNLTRSLQQAQLDESKAKLAQLPFETDKLKAEASRLQSQAEIYRKAASGEIQFTTAPDGTIIPIIPTTSGGKEVSSKEKSARDFARDAEFNTMGTPTLTKPSFVDQKDWDQATEEQRHALLKRLGLL